MCGARITERVRREGMSPRKKGRRGKGGEDERKEGWKEQDKEKEDGRRMRRSSFPFFPDKPSTVNDSSACAYI